MGKRVGYRLIVAKVLELEELPCAVHIFPILTYTTLGGYHPYLKLTKFLVKFCQIAYSFSRYFV